jgi:hypothetical protein
VQPYDLDELEGKLSELESELLEVNSNQEKLSRSHRCELPCAPPLCSPLRGERSFRPRGSCAALGAAGGGGGQVGPGAPRSKQTPSSLIHLSCWALCVLHRMSCARRRQPRPHIRWRRWYPCTMVPMCTVQPRPMPVERSPRARS